jgi:hypothetical protein
LEEVANDVLETNPGIRSIGKSLREVLRSDFRMGVRTARSKRAFFSFVSRIRQFVFSPSRIRRIALFCPAFANWLAS